MHGSDSIFQRRLSIWDITLVLECHGGKSIALLGHASCCKGILLAHSQGQILS